MKKDKKILKITIITILVIAIIGIGLAIAYMTTDFLKTDKQLFFKYIAEANTIMDNFDDQDLKTYFEKQKSTPYENNGEIGFNFKFPRYETQIKDVNNLKIAFNGKIDSANDKIEQQIKINYSDDVNFPFSYKHTGDLYALGSEIVANKYIAIRNDNLKELFAKFGADEDSIEQIPNKIEAIDKQSKLSDKEKQELLEKYYKILKDNLKNSNFSRTDKTTFTLTLTQEELKTLSLALLEELKNDQILLKNNKETIEELITELQNTEASTEQALKMSFYRDEGKLSKIEIRADNTNIDIQIVDSKITILFSIINDNKEQITPVINIEKVKQNNELNYFVTFRMQKDENVTEIYYTAKYTDINSQNSKENYVLGIKNITTDKTTQNLEEMQYEYTLETNKKFLDNINIEDLTENTALILNDNETEYVQEKLNEVGQRITELNKRQMEQLQLRETNNPLYMTSPIGMLIFNQLQSAIEIENQILQQIPEQFEDLEQNQQQSTNMLIDAANQKFKQYEGTNVSGRDIKSLLDQIISTNSQATSDKNQQITKIIYNEQELAPKKDIITNIKNVIDSSASYTVNFQYSLTSGLIETVIIKQNPVEKPTQNGEQNQTNTQLNNQVQNQDVQIIQNTQALQTQNIIGNSI